MEFGERFKGNLRGSYSPIIKVKIRNHNGTPAHRAEFRVDDRSSMVQFLSLLKDKFGIDCFYLKPDYLPKQKDLIQEEKQHLDEWREKTKGLREEDESFKKRMREVFRS